MPKHAPFRRIDKYWNEKQLARDFGSGLNDVIGRGALAGLVGGAGDIAGVEYNTTIINRPLTAPELTNLEKFNGTKSGVTIP